MVEDRHSDGGHGEGRTHDRNVGIETRSGREAGERTALDPRGWSASTAIFATIGAAATGYLAVYAYSRMGRSDPSRGGAAFSDNQRHAATDFSSTRSAGPDAMRDPPKRWEAADEASDESFPASDPPAVGSRVD